MTKFDVAVSAMEHARETHAQWLTYWQGLPCKGECEKCEAFAASVGGIDHQDHWVSVYDNVLAVLNRHQKMCAALGFCPDCGAGMPCVDCGYGL